MSKKQYNYAFKYSLFFLYLQHINTMHGSKIIEILKTFSKNELKLFEKFINSPYTNNGRDIASLFKIAKKNYPDFKRDKIAKQTVFFQLFPDEPYGKKKIENMIYSLTKLAEDFLISAGQNNNKFQKLESLAGQYKQRRMDKFFLQTVREIEKIVNENLFNRFEGFKEEEKLHNYRVDYYISTNDYYKAVEEKTKVADINSADFIISYFKTLREKIISEKSYNIPFPSISLKAFSTCLDSEKLLYELKKNKYEYYYLAAIYYHNMKAAESTDNSPDYFNFKKLVLNNLGKFKQSERYMLFSDMISFCVDKENSGDESYQREEFEVIKKMLETNSYTWSENDYLQIIFYRNIMILSLVIKELDWLEEFAEKYTNMLRPEYRQNMKNLLLANIRFAQKKFEESLTYINKVKYDVFLYKMDVKQLMTSIYYELNLFEQAYALIDAFKHYISASSEISELMKKRCLNYLAYYKKMLQLKSKVLSSGKASGENIIDSDLLVKKIEAESVLPSKRWLLDKAVEMKYLRKI